MPDSIFLWATLGGFISFLATTVGSLFSLTHNRIPTFTHFKFTIDFALGLMLSAVAFSLVGPAAKSFFHQPLLLSLSLLGFLTGSFCIFGLKIVIERNQKTSAKSSSELLLALALIIHNFPEGLASGGALAGLDFEAALPILSSVALQNVPEGLMMVLCLKGMGWKSSPALWGGIASGAMELLGGLFSGVALSVALEALPIILMLAGGAMFTSVVIELTEKGNTLSHLKHPQFAMGFILVPLFNLMLMF